MSPKDPPPERRLLVSTAPSPPHANSASPRARQSKQSARKPTTLPRSKKESQNTVTQMQWLVPDSDAEDDVENGEPVAIVKRDLETNNPEGIDQEWESPQPRKRRRTATSSSRAPQNRRMGRSVSENQGTITQMPGWLHRSFDREESRVLDSEGEEEIEIFHDASESISAPTDAMNKDELDSAMDAANDLDDTIATRALKRQPLGDITASTFGQSPSLQPVEDSEEDKPFLRALKSTQTLLADEEFEIAVDDSVRGDEHEDQDVEAETFEIHEDESVIDEEDQVAPRTPASARTTKRSIPSSRSPAYTPIKLSVSKSRSLSRQRQRLPLHEVSRRELLRREEQAANTPTKGKARVSGNDEDEENVPPEEPFETDTSPTNKKKSSPLKNQLSDDVSVEFSQLINERRRLNLSPSPSPAGRRIHSVGSSHVRAMRPPLSTLDTSDDEIDLDEIGEPDSPTKHIRSTGNTPATSFSPRTMHSQAQASPTARLLFKRPSQPNLKSSRRRQSDFAASQATTASGPSSAPRPSAKGFVSQAQPASPTRPPRIDLDSLPPPSSMPDFDMSIRPDQLMSISQLMAPQDEDAEDV